MLQCNNCGTKLPDDTSHCTHCRMSGPFLHIPDDGVPVSDEKQQCMNCGQLIGLQMPKCPHCRFPVSRAKQGLVKGSTFVIGNLKAG